MRELRSHGPRDNEARGPQLQHTLWSRAPAATREAAHRQKSLHTAVEEDAEQFYEDLQDLELTPKKDVLFVIGDWNAEVGSQRIPE